MASNSRGYLRGRLVGQLIEFHNSDKGYAFLATGPNNPEYYVPKSAVPPEHWFEGSLLEFTPAPPMGRGQNMRAKDIIPRNDLSEERAS